jgi:hypothetical protein
MTCAAGVDCAQQPRACINEDSDQDHSQQTPVNTSNAYSTIASHPIRRAQRKLPLKTTVCN